LKRAMGYGVLEMELVAAVKMNFMERGFVG
jgi:hypothetical protein